MTRMTHYSMRVFLFCCILLSAFTPQQAKALWVGPGSRECKTEIKWERFVCLLPRGATEETFFGEFSIYNAYTCSDMSYYIAAVDPVTGLTNGTVDPSSGPLAAGWNTSLYFSYNPDPGVTAVRFIIVFVCGGKTGYKVCQTTLGEFDKLDNRDVYPCRDYFKMAQAASAGTLQIAPNPAGSQATISYNIPDRSPDAVYTISVVNLMGQQVAQYSVNSSTGYWQYPADQLSSGTYIVRLMKDGVNLNVQRMIIAH